MKQYIITALAGLMVSCGQNSVKPQTSLPENMANETIVEPSSHGIISVNRRGNPNGRTVILIPGLASSADVWDDTVTVLNNFDLRIVQVSGFAGVEAFQPDGHYTDAMAASINEHLNQYPGRDAAVIGHSMGGFVAIKAALVNNTDIDELIIVDSLPFLAEMFMPGSTPEQAAQTAPIMAAQMAAMPRAVFDNQQAAGLGRLVKTRAFIQTLEAWGKTSDQSTVAAVMGELLAADLRADLSNLKAAVTVLAAYDEAMGVPLLSLEALYKAQFEAVPVHKIHMVEDSFHFIMIDQRDKFLSIIKQALTD